MAVLAAWSERRAPDTLPNFDLWLIVPAAASAGLAAASFERLPLRLGAGAVAIAAAVALDGLGSAWLGLLLVLPLAILSRAALDLRRREPVRAEAAAGAILVAIVAVAALERWDMLLAYLPRPLDPDAQAYLSLSLTTSGFDTGLREPLFLWMLQGAQRLTGDSTGVSLRLFTYAVSFVTIASLFAFARRHLGLAAAVVSALVYALLPSFVYTAVRGLREELVILAFLAFAWLYLDAWTERPTLGRWSAIGLAAAPFPLLRLNTAPFVVASVLLLCVVSAVRFRLGIRRSAIALVPLVIAFTPITPYLVRCAETYGDPFVAVSMQTRFYANWEFAGTRPDFPSREAFARDAYAGRPISLGVYLFKYHTVPEVAQRTLRGIWEVFAGDFARIWFAAGGVRDDRLPLLYLLHLAGLVALALSPARPFLLLAFLFHGAVYFLVSALESYGPRAFDWRLLTVAFAAFTIGIGAAAQAAYDAGRLLVRRYTLRSRSTGGAAVSPARAGEAPS